MLSDVVVKCRTDLYRSKLRHGTVSVAKRCCCKVSPICTKKIKKAIVKFQLLSDVVVKCRVAMLWGCVTPISFSC